MWVSYFLLCLPEYSHFLVEVSIFAHVQEIGSFSSHQINETSTYVVTGNFSNFVF